MAPKITPKKFNLPSSSYDQLKKIIQAYYRFEDDVTIHDIKISYNIPYENTSRNLGFLGQVGIISGTRIKKKITERGKVIGEALKNNHYNKINAFWREIIHEVEPFGKLVSSITSSIEEQGSIEGQKLRKLIIHLAKETPTFGKDRGAQTIIDILIGLEILSRSTDGNNKPFYVLKSNTPKPKPYVDFERINQLENIKSEKFDMLKLIELCKELNDNYTNENYMAVGMLSRAILDHVPPIFDSDDFLAVANNYAGTKSFRRLMQNLQSSSRNISDNLIHSQIRKSEVLPNKNQVDFSPDLDVLLAEIIRLLKK